MIEFVSYNGEYPNLCSGSLTVKIDEKTVCLPSHLFYSGGCAWFDEEWNAYVESGKWKIDMHSLPKEYAHLVSELEEVMNDNVPWGCCGGCL